MDAFKLELANEWLQQLDGMIEQIEESDNGEFTTAIDLLSQCKEDIEEIIS